MLPLSQMKPYPHLQNVIHLFIVVMEDCRACEYL